MAKKTKLILITLIIFIVIIVLNSMRSSTTAIVHIAEIGKHNITVTMEWGDKTDIKVPSKFDTSEFNTTSHYLVVYYSNIFRRNILNEIEETK